MSYPEVFFISGSLGFFDRNFHKFSDECYEIRRIFESEYYSLSDFVTRRIRHKMTDVFYSAEF